MKTSDNKSQLPETDIKPILGKRKLFPKKGLLAEEKNKDEY